MGNKRVIIKFKDDITSNQLEEAKILIDELKCQVIHDNGIIMSILADDNDVSLIENNQYVDFIENDSQVNILGFGDKELSTDSKYILKMDITIPWNISRINAPKVWDLKNRGSGIKGCIIDTGIDFNHPNLKDNFKGGWNAIEKNDNVMDDNGHGTNVAGIAAAKAIDSGIMGVAPELDIYAVKVLDSEGNGWYSDIISGVQWSIDNKMQLINMSIGGLNYSQAFDYICKTAYDNNILMIAAAGNRGLGGDTITYPAKFESVIAVGAIDIDNNKAIFSSTGDKLELAAPGVNILSTVPSGDCKNCDNSGFKLMSGTSMASPHVFGTAALVLKSNIEYTNVNIRTILNNNSLDLGLKGRDKQYGYGMVDAYASVINKPIPPPIVKYDYHEIGRDKNLYGFIVTKNKSGSFTSDEACIKSCETLKKIDSL